MITRTKRASKRSFAAVVAAALIASVLALVASPASAAQPVTITARATFAGTDRYNTSELVRTATAAIDATTDLVLASGENYPDALAAIALAEKEDAGVILLPSSGVMSVKAVAAAAAATHVWIVGGTSALSSAVETTLKTTTGAGGAGKATAAITRVAGTDRYATAALVANKVGSGNVASFNTKKTAIIVSGENFADAVSASMLVSGPNGTDTANAHPILLVQKDSVPVATEVQLQSLGVKQVVIIGGTSAVSAAVATTLGAKYTVVRVSGADRFATAAAVADLAVKSVVTGGFGMSKGKVYLAEMGAASGGADALAAGQIVNANASVLLGTSGGALPSASSAWLTANKTGSAGTTLNFIGGTGVIPTATENEAKLAAGGSATAVTATISNLRASQTDFYVTFSEPVTQTSIEGTSMVQIDVATGADSSVTCTMTKTLGGAAALASTATGTFATCVTTAVAKGDTIRILKDVIATSDGRKVGQSDTTVAGDTTKPVATVSSLCKSSCPTITITFSEPVKVVNTLVNGDIKVGGVANATTLTLQSQLNGVDVDAAGSAYADLATTSVINTLKLTNGSNWTAGSTVQLIAGVVADLNGNTNAAASAVLATDAVAPTVLGQPIASQSVKAQAEWVMDSRLLIELKTGSGTTNGSQGNTWDITWVDATAANSITTTNTCTMDTANEKAVLTGATIANGQNGANATPALMAAAINAASGTCSTYMKATVLGGATAWSGNIFDTAQADGDRFNGGSHDITITTTMSEAIAAGGVAAGGVKWDPACDNTFTASTVAATTISGSTITTVHNITADSKVLVAGTSCVDYDGSEITDVAGNAAADDEGNLVLISN